MQWPTAASIFAGRTTAAAWHTKPSWYAVSKLDYTINPDLERFLAKRMAGSDRIPIPSLLACAAVHHHLIRTGLRTSVGIVVESGEPREVHHFATLAGYGAEAINPYLAFETITAMKDRLPGKLDDKEIVKRYIKSIGKGLLKVMSKMGISTYQSYCGA